MQIMKVCSVYVMQTFSNIQQGTNTVHRIHQLFKCVWVWGGARACVRMRFHVYMVLVRVGVYVCVCVCVGGGMCMRIYSCMFLFTRIFMAGLGL